MLLWLIKRCKTVNFQTINILDVFHMNKKEENGKKHYWSAQCWTSDALGTFLFQKLWEACRPAGFGEPWNKITFHIEIWCPQPINWKVDHQLLKPDIYIQSKVCQVALVTSTLDLDFGLNYCLPGLVASLWLCSSWKVNHCPSFKSSLALMSFCPGFIFFSKPDWHRILF